MLIESTNLKQNMLTVDTMKKQDTALQAPKTDADWLLSLTSRFNRNGLMNVERVMSAQDVYSGAIEKEIDKIVNEEEQISSIIKANTNALTSQATDKLLQSVRATSAKTIGFVEYTGKNAIKPATNSSAIKSCIVANNDKESKLISDAIDTMVAWLDDYIVNYNLRVAEGNLRGDSELKFSFLLEIRKAIENCDFKVGFGTVGTGNGYDYQTGSNIQGSYFPSLLVYNDGSTVGYDTYHLNSPDRNIKLNPEYFMPERNYTSVAELQAAFDSGITEFYPTDLLIDDEAYYNYCKTNLATTLWHELIHSTHIYNEYVTYYATDAFEDDIADKNIEGFSAETINYLKQHFVIASDGGLSYKEVGVTHHFENYNQVVDFAWSAIQENNKKTGAFDTYMPGFTKAMCEAELKNFMATA